MDVVACPNCGSQSTVTLTLRPFVKTAEPEHFVRVDRLTQLRLGDGGYISIDRGRQVRHACAGPDRPWEDVESIDRAARLAASQSGAATLILRVVHGDHEGSFGTLRHIDDDDCLVVTLAGGESPVEISVPAEDIAVVG